MRAIRTLAALGAFLTASPGPVAARECAGDCDGDGMVVVAELVRSVGISLEEVPLARCPAVDVGGDGRVGIDELVGAVNSLVHTCPHAFRAQHAAVRADAEALTPEDFADRYPQPAPVATLSYDPLGAAFLAQIEAAVGIADPQREILQHNGFAVLEHAAYPTFGEAYEALYAKHLPVFVSADSLLHALHRSYDSILMMLEVTTLMGELEALLDGMHATLAAKRAAGEIPEPLEGAARDVDVYLTVARSLLSATRVAPHFGADADVAVDAILADAETRQRAPLPLFGRPRDEHYDYSQLEPRGHYADSLLYPSLRDYFEAMMWLGRTEMGLVRYVDGEARFNRAAFDAALLLHALLRDSGRRPSWERINLVIERMVGEKDGMDAHDLDAFTAANDLTDLTAVAAAPDDVVGAALLASPYGLQRIMSQILASEPWEPTRPLPRVFLLFGQRFTIDSYVFHRVTYDRLIDPDSGLKTLRMLPSELDVQFALGSNTAGNLLADEIAHFRYQGALHELRFLVDAHPPQFWEANLYNGWLHAMRSLNDELAQAGRPQSLRTTAWALKTVETQLAAWAELRHDTILYTKQSYSLQNTCTYPDAYLEPVPRFLSRMAHLGRRGAGMAEELRHAGFHTESVRAYFDNFRVVMERLQVIAEKELAGAALADEELGFLRMTIEKEIVGCGETHYDGWYASLFFDNLAVVEFKPTIADVHTAPSDELGNPVGWVLHAATGRPGLTVVTVDSCTGPRAYVGPVSSYYSVLTTELQRLTDRDWEGRLDGSNTRPAWTLAYRR